MPVDVLPDCFNGDGWGDLSQFFLQLCFHVVLMGRSCPASIPASRKRLV
jgi:hypothetical protein